MSNKQAIFNRSMKKLPIHHVLPEILSTLERENRLILQAAPGAGKTTIVPLALLEASWLKGKQILMLEPRRLSTRSAAARMASLLGEKVGQRVGYQIRSDRCVSQKTQILVVTEGILTRMLQSDPDLENIGLIIFDEFHERHLHGDLALALSLQSQEFLREDLKIMVMSATLNTQALSTALEHPPLIKSEGRSFPVENIYLDAKAPHPIARTLNTLVAHTVEKALHAHSGDILVFLPGRKEIREVEERLHVSLKKEDVLIMPLFAEISKEAQDRAIAPSSQRKVVLATNIAETSLTIEGIEVVVDAGLQRVSLFDSGSGMNRLTTVAISQDAATQRSGRAGRLSAGRCYRLWHQHKVLVKHSPPEILSSDLSSMMLELAQWGVDELSTLVWLDLPPQNAQDHAKTLLQQLGALQEKEITDHGKEILHLGLHPRLAHMILKANALSLAKEATIIAALLSEKDIFRGSLKNSADLSERVLAIQQRESSSEIDRKTVQQVIKSAQTFQSRLSNITTGKNIEDDTIGLLLALAYPDRIAKIRGKNLNSYLLSGGKGAQLFHEDALVSSPYLVVADLDNAKGAMARIYRAVRIEEETLYHHFQELITKETVARWNGDAQRIEARELHRLGAITLKERPTQKISQEQITAALIGVIREEGLQLLNFSKETLQLQQRVNFLNHHREHQNLTRIEALPDFSEKYLLEYLEQWLAPHLLGLSTLKAVQRVNMHSILLTLLSWEQQKQVDILAPSRLKVPSGSNIIVDYSDPQTPSLSVRLQELFGLLETPTLLNHNVPLTIELLSPAMRPMQVTKDLKSFWDNTYDEVKKELRGKYKRHYWPDDPYEAVATSKTKKRM